MEKIEKCAHKGCKRTTANSSLFSVNGKAKYCAEHLTTDRAKTSPKGEPK
jgi:hypothetical protein